MSRYIDADALRAFIKDQYFHCDMPEEWGNGVMWATSQINHYCNKAPSIDIEPKHGEWIDRGMRVPSSWVKKCSLCGHETDTWRWCNFCPNCGADMRERKESE